MICDEDPFRRRPRKSAAQMNTTGGVCLNGGKSGHMAVQTRADSQIRALGCLQTGCRSLGSGTVVQFSRFWMSSGESRLNQKVMKGGTMPSNFEYPTQELWAKDRDHVIHPFSDLASLKSRNPINGAVTPSPAVAQLPPMH